LVIENCSISDLKTRETYWISVLEPYYNVFKQAYDSTGYRHTPETRLLLSELAKLRTHSDETRSKISESLKGENNPFFNKVYSDATKYQISLTKSTSLIYVYDSFKQLLFIFPSLRFLAGQVKANFSTLSKLTQNGLLFRGGWYILKSPFYAHDVPSITDINSVEYVNMIKEIQTSSHILKAIFVFNSKNEFLFKFDGVLEAQKALNISHDTIKSHLDSGKAHNNYLFFSHRVLELGH
jgi:hypothetical protein